jgi:hypothetical protein
LSNCEQFDSVKGYYRKGLHLIIEKSGVTLKRPFIRRNALIKSPEIGIVMVSISNPDYLYYKINK